VLHLQTSVHFHKVKTVVHRVENELHCARIVVANGPRSSDGSLADLQAQLF